MRDDPRYRSTYLHRSTCPALHRTFHRGREETSGAEPGKSSDAGKSSGTWDRRAFLKQSGVAAGALGALGSLPLSGVRKAEAGPPPPAGATVKTRKNICTHCSVGCSVIAEVANGVW